MTVGRYSPCLSPHLPQTRNILSHLHLSYTMSSHLEESTWTDSRVVGIDLGTTNSCVAIWRNHRVEIIPNDQGNRITPSCVAFAEETRLFGETAVNQAATNPRNTIFGGVKRLLGRPFDDPNVQSDIKKLPFKVVNNRGRSFIEVEYRGEQKEFSPEEISSMMLLKLKHSAEAHLGFIISEAVIAVPAHFNSFQRQATRNAGKIAGLNVIRVANEPTSVAIAYGFNRKFDTETTVLIFDIGGGTLDVALLVIEGAVHEVKAIAGRTHLGGDDFDDRLVGHFVQEFARKFGRDIKTNPRAMRRLRTACERAKRILSSASQAAIEVDAVFEGIDFYTTLSRSRFEELCQDLFDQTLKPVQEVLEAAQINKCAVQEILVTGGSTRIPYIVSQLSKFFDGKEVVRSINVDESVAYGAAIQAAILDDSTDKRHQNVVAVNGLPVALGIETSGNGAITQRATFGGSMNKIAPQNILIPTKLRKVFPNYSHNQRQAVIKVYEGSHAETKDNQLLGMLELEITPLPMGESQISVTIDIDADGIVQVEALDIHSGTQKTLVIHDETYLSSTELARMVEEAQLYLAHDGEFVTRIEAKNQLEAYVYKLQNAVNDTLAWLERSQYASKEEYEEHFQELFTQVVQY
ncbi:heat shock cognate 70 [Mycena floridula]|nr:heat shock cognate 70 [Mycena floridula]